MQAKKFKFPSELHGNANGTMQQYFNAVGLINSEVKSRPSSAPTNPLPTGSMGSAVSPVGASTVSVSSVGPSISSNTVASTNLPTSPTAPTNPIVSTSEAAPTGSVSNVGPSVSLNPVTSPNVNQLTPINVPILTPVPVVVNPLIVAKNPNGTTVSAPLAGGFGGGFGGGGGYAEEDSRMAEVKKKSNLFPWLLIAAGIYIIVKNPIK